MKSFYIATRLENHAQHNRVRDELHARGYKITYDWTTHGPAWPQGMAYVREVMRQERKGVLDADFVVVLLPGGKGTHVELGIAIAKQIPVFLVTEDLSFLECLKGFCGFYVSDNVQHFKSVDDLLKTMKWVWGWP
jgi:nucleoside 2-deoxyribosyltransferase